MALLKVFLEYKYLFKTSSNTFGDKWLVFLESAMQEQKTKVIKVNTLKA